MGLIGLRQFSRTGFSVCGLELREVQAKTRQAEARPTLHHSPPMLCVEIEWRFVAAGQNSRRAGNPRYVTLALLYRVMPIDHRPLVRFAAWLPAFWLLCAGSLAAQHGLPREPPRVVAVRGVAQSGSVLEENAPKLTIQPRQHYSLVAE